MPVYIYVSISEEDRVSIFEMDAGSGKLDPRGVVEAAGRPAPMTIDPERRFLYVGRRAVPEISSFQIDQSTGGPLARSQES